MVLVRILYNMDHRCECNPGTAGAQECSLRGEKRRETEQNTQQVSAGPRAHRWLSPSSTLVRPVFLKSTSQPAKNGEQEGSGRWLS
jgi:hypothetical protein